MLSNIAYPLFNYVPKRLPDSSLLSHFLLQLYIQKRTEKSRITNPEYPHTHFLRHTWDQRHRFISPCGLIFKEHYSRHVAMMINNRWGKNYFQ